MATKTHTSYDVKPLAESFSGKVVRYGNFIDAVEFAAYMTERVGVLYTVVTVELPGSAPAGWADYQDYDSKRRTEDAEWDNE